MQQRRLQRFFSRRGPGMRELRKRLVEVSMKPSTIQMEEIAKPDTLQQRERQSM